ncbi:PAF acetylhydrolase family protein [Pleomassaria siparia CBS 279.74]|uniref:1-alkyl-2-acetylglycerophosphocholine esterase n=1 Tax=Pleomassaria siparia CBS 279.74 TaxID=1314801 RepID=A0A6G1JUP7_9PLEO|nr:PAF acetylhydrolase family protein [Pleomassaria siparia CBS 279.74]
MYIHAQILIPAPSGQYATHHSVLKLTDTSRADPYDPLHGPRNVLISLFYPVSKQHCHSICPSPYMTPVTASLIDATVAELGVPNGTFGAIRLQVCCGATSEAFKEVSKTPVILFSPGLGGTRLLYSALAQSLAGTGYAVATLDHVYEAQIVEYPDGTLVPSIDPNYFNSSIPGRLESALAVRVADAQFVLTQLGSKSVAQELLPGATCGFKKGNAGFYGHSFGGATAISTLMQDSRFAGAVNLDGAQYGPLEDTKKPALFFGRGDPSAHNRTNDATWANAWMHLKGWRREVQLKGIEHLTFGDAPLLIELTGLPVTDAVTSYIGSLDAGRSYEVITKVVQKFFDGVFKGKKDNVFEGNSTEYPELVMDW